MVGVPGKYKGCNTCRARRVKCDNERPKCRKCLETGRDCQGYERETVFIVGTPEDKGRCSSHPPRNLKSAKSTPSTSPRSSEEPKPDITPIRPLDSAWGSAIAASDGEVNHQLRVVALHVPLYMVNRIRSNDNDGRTRLSLPTYSLADIRPQFREEHFVLRSQCLVHLNDDTPGKVSSSSTSSDTESVLLFLYEHNASSLSGSTLPSWQASLWSQQGDSIREMGPGAWTDFPAHHFFARVYRPSAVATAVLNRRPIFCSDPEWLSIPWQKYPKSQFDKLLDIMLQIPALLQRVDHLSLSLEPSLDLVQDLLEACLLVRSQLEQWQNSIHQIPEATFWISPDQTTTEFPFTDVFAFRDGCTALLLLYYWTAQVSLFPCIELLSHSIATPVSDPFIQQATVGNTLVDYSLLHQQQQQQFYSSNRVQSHNLQNIDYSILYGPQKLRDIAANICRGLDFALQATSQPDLLAFPAQVVAGFYSGLNAMATMALSRNSSNSTDVVVDAALELIWLGRFRSRMAIRGQGIAEMVKERRWVDLAEY